MYQYRGKIVNVVDGDTFDVDIDLGFHITRRERVRVFGVDTPEMNSPDTTKRQLAVKAKNFLTSLAFSNPDVILRTQKDRDKYGRYLAKVTFDFSGNEYDLAEELIKNGLAAPYDGGKKILG